MGEVMVSAGSDCPPAPSGRPLRPRAYSCSPDVYSISVSPMRTMSPTPSRSDPVTRCPFTKVAVGAAVVDQHHLFVFASDFRVQP